MGLKLQDVQDKGKIFAEIRRAYKTTLKWNNWALNDFTFKKPPDGWVTSVDQAKEAEAELTDKNDKRYEVWLKTKSPRGVAAKADAGSLKRA
jgi:hypothetical protein